MTLTKEKKAEWYKHCQDCLAYYKWNHICPLRIKALVKFAKEKKKYLESNLIKDEQTTK